MAIVKNNLRTLLRKKGWSYPVFAKLMGQPSKLGSIKNWAINRNQPSEENVKLICSTLGCSPKQLFYIPIDNGEEE